MDLHQAASFKVIGVKDLYVSPVARCEFNHDQAKSEDVAHRLMVYYWYVTGDREFVGENKNATQAQQGGIVRCDYIHWIEILCHDIIVHIPHHISHKIPSYSLWLAHEYLRLYMAT